MDSAEWEEVPSDRGLIFRLRVPGGWLVSMCDEVTHVLMDGRLEGGWDWRSTMTFVPDPQREWFPDIYGHWPVW